MDEETLSEAKEREKKEEEEVQRKKADAEKVVKVYEDAAKDIKVPTGYTHTRNTWVRGEEHWAMTEDGAHLERRHGGVSTNA